MRLRDVVDLTETQKRRHVRYRIEIMGSISKMKITVLPCNMLQRDEITTDADALY
jgi:hypothetical protein